MKQYDNESIKNFSKEKTHHELTALTASKNTAEAKIIAHTVQSNILIH